jgi:hypothetical protein
MNIPNLLFFHRLFSLETPKKARTLVAIIRFKPSASGHAEKKEHV